MNQNPSAYPPGSRTVRSSQFITVVVGRDPPSLYINIEMAGVNLLPGLTANLSHCPAFENDFSQQLADFPGRQRAWGKCHRSRLESYPAFLGHPIEDITLRTEGRHHGFNR